VRGHSVIPVEVSTANRLARQVSDDADGYKIETRGFGADTAVIGIHWSPPNFYFFAYSSADLACHYPGHLPISAAGYLAFRS
jgi:hypothetical protein